MPQRSTWRYPTQVFRGLDFQHDHYLLHHLDSLRRVSQSYTVRVDFPEE
jgi:hypothetical protein